MGHPYRIPSGFNEICSFYVFPHINCLKITFNKLCSPIFLSAFSTAQIVIQLPSNGNKGASETTKPKTTVRISASSLINGWLWNGGVKKGKYLIKEQSWPWVIFYFNLSNA